VFEEVTKREGGKRAAQRISWIAGSTALQVALVAGIIAASAALAKRVAEGPLVPVKLVKPPAPVVSRPPPPPPPPAPKQQVKVKPKVEAKPRQAMLQPKEVPQELKEPEKTAPEPEEDYSDEGVEGGVVGGVVGGEPNAPAVAAAPPAPKPVPRVTTPPVAIRKPDIQYPQQALEHEVEGTIVVDCIIAADGTVRNCRILKSLPYMDRAVISALERARYQPFTVGGKPSDVAYTFTIKLNLGQ
jgi:protein TonB